jgi:hypothetical protein
VKRRQSGAGGTTTASARSLYLLVLAAGATQARIAAAQPLTTTRPVFVARSACETVPFAEIAAVLRVELLNRLVEDPPADAYRAAIDCTGDLVAISVTLPGGAGKSRQTNLAGSPPNVRPRIVALAIAELVRDVDREPVRIVAPERPPSPPKDVPKPPPPLPPRRTVELGAFAQTSSFRLDGVWLTGGGLRFDYVYRWFCVGFDVAALQTVERFTQGSAQVFLGYGSPFVAWNERWGRAQTFLGAGYALGVAHLAGQANDARAFAGTTSGPWAAPYAFAALAVVVADGVTFDARGQVGWVTSPVIGNVTGGHDVALEGLWASVQLGLAIAL